MLDTLLEKKIKKWFVEPLAKKLYTVSPNTITILALVVGVFISPLLYFHKNILSIIMLCLTGYLDMLDGCIARIHKKKSNKGAVLDIICDRIVELFILFGIVLYNTPQRLFLGFVLLGCFYISITSFLVVSIFISSKSMKYKSFNYSFGIIERSETFIAYLFLILFPNNYSFLMFLFIIAVIINIIYRIYSYKQII